MSPAYNMIFLVRKDIFYYSFFNILIHHYKLLTKFVPVSLFEIYELHIYGLLYLMYPSDPRIIKFSYSSDLVHTC